MKILKYIVGAGIVFMGGRYLYQLHRAGKKVVVSVGGRVDKVALEGVVVVMNYNIKNPTNSSIEMSTPLISLAYDGTVLASSSMALVEVPEDARSKNGRILIRPFKETGTITTSILLPTLSLLGAGAKLLTRLKDRLLPDSEETPIEFEVVTTSTVFTKVGSFPYDETIKMEV
ncbi:MAG: hypothetical protein MK086_14215 [Flavobacteriales bacterium]|nr:hypothetical protein [Flavobacteriales bacterium]